MDLSVVIPAYNEVKRIRGTLDAVCGWLSRKPGLAWEVIVVDNRSSDETARVVGEFSRTRPQVRVIREERPGKGYAVTAGMLAAAGKVRLFTDADNSTDISHYDLMAPFLSQGYDVVIGSLAVSGAKVVRGGGEPLWRVLFGKLGNKWIQLFAVWGINDTQRGFKVFSERAARDIFPRLTIFGWGFDVEVLAIARQRGYRIREVPVTWDNPPDTRVNVWSYPQVLLQTLKVSFNRLTGKYS